MILTFMLTEIYLFFSRSLESNIFYEPVSHLPLKHIVLNAGWFMRFYMQMSHPLANPSITSRELTCINDFIPFFVSS